MSLSACNICPRACNANRVAGARGICTQNGAVTLARVSLHMWEEPPISGQNGSGTVFFSGCPLQCVYCQNHSISTGVVAKEVSIQRLAEIFLEQQERGAHNINLVSPTQFTPQIIQALDLAKNAGLEIPVVYNTSGYESVETLKMLDGYVDIYLTDFKYALAESAKRYSKAPDYAQVASLALDEMFRQVGSARFDDDGELMQSGIIVRHLLLPGWLEDSLAVMDILADKPYRNDIIVSLMNQYTPMPGIGDLYPELAGTVSDDEYDALIDYALDIGLENSFCQEGGAADESFIPDFDFSGI